MRKHNASVSDSELNQVGGTRTRKRQSAAEHIRMANEFEDAKSELSFSEKLATNYYTSKVPYPRKSDFKIKETVTTRHFGERSFEGIDEVAYRAAQTEYGNDQRRLNEEFRRDAIEAVGLTGHPKADKAYAYADEHGHSSGYQDIYNILIDVAELVK